MNFNVPMNKERVVDSEINGLCIYCQHSVIKIDRNYLALSLGAYDIIDNATNRTLDENMFAFLDMSKAKGPVVSSIDVFRDIPFGQVRLYFCNRNCLLAFINKIVDKIEDVATE